MEFTERFKRRLASDEKTQDVTISDTDKRYEWEKAVARKEVTDTMRELERRKQEETAAVRAVRRDIHID